ncbi:(Fe-S)-binding protein [Marinicrinis lubricantis]
MWGTWIHLILFVIVTCTACFWFIQVISRRLAYIRLGNAVKLEGSWRGRWKKAVIQTFGQTKLLKDRKSGMMHAVMFYGFIILQFGALDLIWRGVFQRGLPLPAYGWFELMQELTVVLILIAVGYAGFRRYAEQLTRLKRGWKPSIVLFFIFFLMLSVLLTLAFDHARHGDAYSMMKPLTSGLSSLTDEWPNVAVEAGFYASWWAHLLILFSFLIYVPQSKHFHLITAPVNLLLGRQGPVGVPARIDFEDESLEAYGVGKVEDFSQKQLLDLYACVECGRCTNVCPASGTGKWLSPMHMIVKLRDHLTEKGAAITSKSPWVPAFAHSFASVHRFKPQAGEHRLNAFQPAPVTSIQATMQAQSQAWIQEEENIQSLDLIGDVMAPEEIWACTTCRNCEDQCPVDNEHVDKIIDLRRHLVLMQGELPSDTQRAMTNIERQGNPWGMNRNDRFQWAQDLAKDDDFPAIHTVKELPEFEYLWFVGSMGSYDNRSRSISKSFARILQRGGVSFAVLGNEEPSSGDTVRRLGNEYLFQEICLQNIELFQSYGVKKIVTCCPHTYNILKNEYPQFGLEAEVYHHTELIWKLIQDERIRMSHPVQETLTYHDSCYLGRYNGVYETPRRILNAVPGLRLTEMERNRSNGMCCGAGGGMMWTEEKRGKRVNIARTEQALETAPTMIGSACPYCLTMLEDGTKQLDRDDTVRVKDIAEIVEMSMFGT